MTSCVLCAGHCQIRWRNVRSVKLSSVFLVSINIRSPYVLTAELNPLTVLRWIDLSKINWIDCNSTATTAVRGLSSENGGNICKNVGQKVRRKFLSRLILSLDWLWHASAVPRWFSGLRVSSVSEKHWSRLISLRKSNMRSLRFFQRSWTYWKSKLNFVKWKKERKRPWDCPLKQNCTSSIKKLSIGLNCPQISTKRHLGLKG